MTSFVDSQPAFEHSGLMRTERVVQFLHASLTCLQALPAGMAVFARRLEVMARAGRRAWVNSRRQAVEDERTWNAALQEARAMAELSRAMQLQAR